MGKNLKYSFRKLPTLENWDFSFHNGVQILKQDSKVCCRNTFWQIAISDIETVEIHIKLL